MKKPLDELAQELNALRGKYQLRHLLHIKTSSRYLLRDFEFRESDMSIWFTYAPSENLHVNFSRPIEELYDGRFQIL